MSKRKGARVLGPYEDRNGWRVIEVDPAGNRDSVLFPTESKATRYVEMMRAELAREDHTTETALEQYLEHMREADNRESSIATTAWAVESFFPNPEPLHGLSAKRCKALYDTFRTTPRERTGKPPSVDTHRNVLAQTKSFLAWCKERGWIRENPCAEVEGIGKRRPGGLSLGKAGNELRIVQARAWYETALARAHRGDDGATASLVALLLGMRASEIVTRRVNDLDTDQAPGDVLWIPCSKTPAGKRVLEVPEVLRELLIACAKGKEPDRYLFEAEPPQADEPSKPHWRDWPRKNVRRICRLAKVPEVTAHMMRRTLSNLTAERGLATHVIAATLGHADVRTTRSAYQTPGATAAGVNRRGLVLLNGGAA